MNLTNVGATTLLVNVLHELNDFNSPAIETKDSLGSVECNTLREAHNVSIEVTTDELEVGEDEGLLGVESNGNNVPRIGLCVTHDFFNSSLLGKQELFV